MAPGHRMQGSIARVCVSVCMCFLGHAVLLIVAVAECLTLRLHANAASDSTSAGQTSAETGAPSSVGDVPGPLLRLRRLQREVDELGESISGLLTQASRIASVLCVSLVTHTDPLLQVEERKEPLFQSVASELTTGAEALRTQLGTLAEQAQLLKRFGPGNEVAISVVLCCVCGASFSDAVACGRLGGWVVQISAGVLARSLDVGALVRSQLGEGKPDSATATTSNGGAPDAVRRVLFVGLSARHTC